MEYDPKATGWLSIIDFVCLIIELPPPFGNLKLREECKFSAKDYKKARKAIFNPESFLINEEKRIIIKNKEIIRVLSDYKVHTYSGKPNMVHFKDVYQNLTKKVFNEKCDDFELSKHLKTKMKNQWSDKHKRVKELSIKSGFKSHQFFASQLITKHLERRKQKLEKKQSLSPKKAGRADLNGDATVKRESREVEDVGPMDEEQEGLQVKVFMEPKVNRDEDPLSRVRVKNRDCNP
jgi:hypothetical protein